MLWDDPSHAEWAPPVEPLLEDASKLEADSWKELGLHPYDDEECEAKLQLQQPTPRSLRPWFQLQQPMPRSLRPWLQLQLVVPRLS